MTGQPTLKRVLSLRQLLLYGLGTTIGAGIYALVGELAAISGYSALTAFLVASIMAAFTAFSFAELSGRFPHAAGAAVYVREGFGSRHFSTLIGLMVISAGLVSSAALINALANYANTFIAVPHLLVVVALAILLGAIAIWGIGESVTVAGIITLVEIGGLIAIIWAGRSALNSDYANWQPLLTSFDLSHWGLAYSGALLAFYAFIGFEDMVVVAEEVKDVSRTLPLAILLTLAISTLLYLTVMAVALLTFTPEELAASATPLVDVYRYYRGDAAPGILTVAMFAIVNGALIQMIMASRVIYGLASRGQLPGFLSRVNPYTRTPLHATLLVTSIVLVLAALGSLSTLAEFTSLIMLFVFACANLALWKIKGRDETSPRSSAVPFFTFPRWVPALGFLVSCLFVIGFFASLLQG